MAIITFLHAADVHLDSPLKGLERYENAPADRIRGATRRAFEGLVGLAIERRVDFVVIAGDLYDGDWKDYNTGLYLISQLTKLHDAGVPVVLISGNHDAANQMTRALKLPGNTKMLAADRPESHVFQDLGVAIHGQSFARRDVTDNLAATYPKGDRALTNIGLLHTGFQGADGHEPYAPCTFDDLRSRDYAYWALGHIHKRQDMSKDLPVVFPGNIQGRHARETGEKGCLIVELDAANHATRTFHRLDVVRWERARVDVTDLSSLSEFEGRVAEALDALLTLEAGSDRLIAARVVVHGTTALHDGLHADPDRWTNEVRNLANQRGDDRLWVEKVEFTTRPTRTVPLPEGPLAELRQVLDDLRADGAGLSALAKELAEQLQVKLPRDLTEGPDHLPLGRPDYLAGLLDRAEPLLLEVLRAAITGDQR